jgi:uncharacterized protein YraI
MARTNLIGSFFEDYDLVEEQVQTIVAQHNLLEICRCEQNEVEHWVFTEYELAGAFVYGDRAERETPVDCVVFENEADCWDAYHERFAEIFEQARA